MMGGAGTIENEEGRMRKAVATGLTVLGFSAAGLGIAVFNPLAAAFAQEGGTTTVPPTAPANPAPGTPYHHPGGAGCPNMGGDNNTPSTPTTPSSNTNASYRNVSYRSSRM